MQKKIIPTQPHYLFTLRIPYIQYIQLIVREIVVCLAISPGCAVALVTVAIEDTKLATSNSSVRMHLDKKVSTRTEQRLFT